VLRELWTLLGANSAATTSLLTLLPGTVGQPIVAWTQTVTAVVANTACEGGGTTTTSTTGLVCVNTKPTSGTALIPTVWWRESIDPNLPSLALLNNAGLSSAQVQAALDTDTTSVHVIEDANLVATFGLTAADLTELLGLDVAGIASLDYEVALASLLEQPAGAANGWLSPSWNWPTDTLKDNLSPTTTMAADIQAIDSSECIDPVKKAGLVTLISMASSLIDTATRLMQRVVGKVRPVLNKISGLLANVQQVLDNLNGSSCIFGLSIEAQLPQLDLLISQLKFATIDFKSFFETIDAMLQVLMGDMICKLQSALRDLLGPDLANVCLVRGLTDLIVNAWGRLQGKLGALGLPCVTNPLGYTSMLVDLQVKIGALASLANSMLADLRSISTQWNLISDIDIQSSDKPTSPARCSSPALATLVGRIKSQFGVG